MICSSAVSLQKRAAAGQIDRRGFLYLATAIGLESLTKSFIEQLSQVFMLPFLHVRTSC